MHFNRRSLWKIEDNGCFWNSTWAAIKAASFGVGIAKTKWNNSEANAVVTAQHRQMLDQILETFKGLYQITICIMGGRNQTLLEITTKF